MQIETSNNGDTCYLVALQIAEAAKTSSQPDDLYLDDTGSGGYYPEDDDDFNSGSGSGKTHLRTHILSHSQAWPRDTHTYTHCQLSRQLPRGMMTFIFVAAAGKFYEHQVSFFSFFFLSQTKVVPSLSLYLRLFSSSLCLLLFLSPPLFLSLDLN